MMRFAASWILGSAVVLAGHAMAAEIELDAVDTGFITEAGGSSKYDALVFPPSAFNYSAGFEVHFLDGGTGGPSGTAPMFRKNYFVFDLGSVADPITSATLVLFNPLGGYESTDPSETFVLAGTGSPTAAGDLATMAALPAPLDPSAVALAIGLYTAITDTLGGLPDFGMASISAVDDGTPVSIPMTAEGVGYLNAGLGGLVVLGGELPSATPPVPIPQSVFGFTAPFFSTPTPTLMITTATPAGVPTLPGPWLAGFVLALGLLGVLALTKLAVRV